MDTDRYRYKFVNVKSRAIRYVNEGAGFAVIFIHSLGGSLEWWDMTMPKLAEHFSVYALDLPGFGGSDRLNEPVSADFLSQFMVQFMETLGIDRASLVGHSMGGYVAARTALDFSQRVAKLVLVASAGFGRIHHPILRALSLPLVGEIAATPTLVGTRIFLRSLVYDKKIVSEDRISTAFRYFKRLGAKQDFLHALRAGATIARRDDSLLTPQDIQKIAVPTMLVWGAEDPVFPASQAELANKLLPHSEIHILARCGHIPQIERATEFNTLLFHFLLSSD